MAIKQLKGVIATNKTKNTVTVEVESSKYNAKYKRYYKAHKKYSAHTEDASKYKVGDKVIIESCTPISKTKRFKVVENKG